ncbi:hypothetical protein N4G69_55480, partial [Streptomyces mirabilis]|uniref:hypothetical protein n=1 Tax=Streptomyces mirabilis TaxID=68239 RepID=UPI0021C0617D
MDVDYASHSPQVEAVRVRLLRGGVGASRRVRPSADRDRKVEALCSSDAEDLELRDLPGRPTVVGGEGESYVA